ncbi:TetR/AcrR family transcriptional regulator [Streptomyces chiangmaiensis]|uniref:TetR/AcrR family transcriptional regulator n=1 Tax=Streptomyces chiangmaiensis TaxID=766497 RepID=A0ABU7FPM2_9ACTN|nr:TetR/AcrR family transcriptional regulator [Streptomyces chiangmaiensis]MED7825039.1 TetR/AcrR family transcriptional regulator [Streptomyces chiangmaiensis]
MEEDISATSAPRRRQARGKRRMAQLLDAAASVFCKCGYTKASTNAIAREAGVSPGTLYQFFPNKEAIAVHLGERLMQQMLEAHGQAFTDANVSLPLDKMLDAILDPIIEFNLRNPAFLALIHGPDTPGEIASSKQVLHATLQRQVEEAITLRAPELPHDQCVRVATTAFVIFREGLSLAMQHQGAERAAYIVELKAALTGYLAPTIGTEAHAVRH